MPERIPQSATIRVPLQAYLSTDHVTPATGKTIAVTISKNGAAFGNPSAGATNATEIASGSYYVDLSTTDTGTIGPLFVMGAVSGVDNIVLVYSVAKATNAGFTALPDAAAAAANGLMVLGVNATATSFTAGLTISNASGDALVLSSSGSNGNGLNAYGNGAADGIHASGGATGRGIHAIGGATSGAGIRCEGTGGNSLGIHGLGTGTGAGMRFEGGISGAGAAFIGGSTSGDGIDITTSVGDGLSILPNGGNAVTLVGNGTSKHGLSITGGTGGTSDGIHAVAGTGGVDIRGNITGNLAGTVTLVSALSTLPAIPANWLTATGIAAAALNGKGDWLLSSSYTAPDNADVITILADATTLLSRITAGLFASAGVFSAGALANTPAPAGVVNANVTQVLGVTPTPLTLVRGAVPSVMVASGLDDVATTAPTGPAATFPGMLIQLWRRGFKKSTMTATQIKTFADDGTTIISTQTISDDGTTQTEGAAT